MARRSEHSTGVQGSAHLIPSKGRPFEKKPVKVQFEKGKTYLWCACGWSYRQPFCDGTHKQKGLGINRPVPYVGEADREVLLCMCKQTENRPFCDGSHKQIKGSLEPDRPPLINFEQSPVYKGVAKKLGFKERGGFHY